MTSDHDATRRLIDFHTHIFPDKLYQAIAGWFAENADWHFPFAGEGHDIAPHLDAVPGLERYVCFGYAHKPGIARTLNRFYADLGAVHPKAVPLGCLHQDDADIGSVAEEALDAGLKGFKIHCQVQQVSPSDNRFDSVFELVSERNGFIMFHAGTGPFLGDHTGFRLFSPLLRRFPRLKCVVAHLGCFEPELFLNAACDRDTLFLDTSYTFIANPRNRMDAPVELVERARERIFFGSDFPGICHSYGESVDVLARIGLSPETLDRIYYRNAADFLSSLR